MLRGSAACPCRRACRERTGRVETGYPLRRIYRSVVHRRRNVDYRDVCILGAGAAGLSCAFVLAENGLDVVVLEKDGVVGGLARTIERDGFRFDIGGHRFFTKDPVINRFFELVVGEELVWVDRISRVYYRGDYFSYPLQFVDTLRIVGPWMGMRMIADYLGARVQHLLVRPPIHTVEDWLVAKFGRVLYETFFRSYTEKVWGMRCAQMSQDWACQRIREMSLTEAIKGLLNKSSRRNVATLIDRFMYAELGIGRLSDRLVNLIGHDRVGLNSEVKRVVLRGQEIQHVEYVRRAGEASETCTVAARSFVSSIPMPSLLLSISPSPPAEVMDAARQLGSRALVTVNLMIGKERVTEDTWLYIQDPRVQMSRIHEPRNWSRLMAPRGMTSLVAEYPCFEGDSVWQTADEELVELALTELCDVLRLLDREEVISGFVARSPHAYPTYHLGYEKPRCLVKRYLRSIPNLQIIGRSGVHRYNNIDHCIESGLMGACNLLGASFDIEAVNIEPSYLEGGVTRPVQVLDPGIAGLSTVFGARATAGSASRDPWTDRKETGVLSRGDAARAA